MAESYDRTRLQQMFNRLQETTENVRSLERDITVLWITSLTGWVAFVAAVILYPLW